MGKAQAYEDRGLTRLTRTLTRCREREVFTQINFDSNRNWKWNLGKSRMIVYDKDGLLLLSVSFRIVVEMVYEAKTDQI